MELTVNQVFVEIAEWLCKTLTAGALECVIVAKQS